MIYRIDVRPRPPQGPRNAVQDPIGASLRKQILEFAGDVGDILTSRVFLVDSDASIDDIRRVANDLLADPFMERADVITTATPDRSGSRIEVHLKPGVMDPVAASAEMAIRDMKLPVRHVRTGRSYVFENPVEEFRLREIANRVLSSAVIESVHFDSYLPLEFATGTEYQFELRHIKLTTLNDRELQRLSRDGHLFLSLAEMQAIQSYFREQGREPTDIELETLAQTWSEHCVHKTLKSAVEVVDESGKTLRRYGNLIKETIFGATKQLMDIAGAKGGAFCLSVFKDNAGVIAFDEVDAVCFKVETHNHPSAIEPYGGSATGIGGCIRDILGTGLGARPVANTDVFCVAYPELESSLPKGVIHPKRVLQQIVAGVRDYGNRMGIPTVNGAVYFDNNYIGNPLVFCGCVGIIPRDKIEKASHNGDAIVVIGGRTGRDGIHGATFSSAELTETHADEFSHAVQIGNAITEKKVADVILQARDRGLFNAITDCGAGGLSSAIGEMGEKTGASVDLDKVPLKYAGLRYDEIWISEAQERMVVAVPQQHVAALLALSKGEDVESTVIGVFGTPDRQLILNFRGTEVGRLSMQFMHDGIPMPTRRAKVNSNVDRDSALIGNTGLSDSARPTIDNPESTAGLDLRSRLLMTLSHPNVASKHWIIRQYDHEVQGGSVIKPLIGPMQIGPSDAAVVRPKLASKKGVAVSAGMAPQIEDPYLMAVHAIDEAVRNAVAVGASPGRMAILDNFCWPSVDDEETMGTLVRACEACRDAALAFGIPFISGKDSLHNQFTNSESGEVIRIPRTLLISAIGVIENVSRCVTMDLKDPREGAICLIGPKPGAKLADLIGVHRAMAEAIAAGHVSACHDVSDGGYVTAVAEMCIASGLGAKLESDKPESLFGERLASYVAEIPFLGVDAAALICSKFGATFKQIGRTTVLPAALEVSKLHSGGGEAFELQVFVDEMTSAWRGTLDW